LDILIRVVEHEVGPEVKTGKSLQESLTEGLLTVSAKMFEEKAEKTSPISPAVENVVIKEIVGDYKKITSQIETKLLSKLTRPRRDSNEQAAKALDQARKIALKIRDDLQNSLDKLKKEVKVLLSGYDNRTSNTPKTIEAKRAKMEELEAYVVSVDLARYGEISPTMPPAKLFDYNLEIIAKVEEAIIEAGARLEVTPLISTGDGAIVFFKTPDPAVEFAIALAKSTLELNRKIDRSDHRQLFRVGIAFGPVCLFKYESPASQTLSVDAAGTAIAKAVRLQTQAAKAEGFAVLVELKVCDKIKNAKLRQAFGDAEYLQLKSHEETLVKEGRLERIQARPIKPDRLK
jgi:class 3 adenylate cyclase